MTIGTVDVGQLADRLAIQDLISIYNRYLDDGRNDLLADLFTDDGVMLSMGQRAEGSDEIRALFGAAADPLPKRPTITHHVSNTVVTINGDEAAAESDLAVHTRDDDGYRMLLVGRFRDALRRTADGWRFTRREPVAMAKQSSR